jgi:hypothetical protein
MWIDDSELIDKIGELSAARIVVGKQCRKHMQVGKTTCGLPHTTAAARLAVMESHFYGTTATGQRAGARLSQRRSTGRETHSAGASLRSLTPR